SPSLIVATDPDLLRLRKGGRQTLIEAVGRDWRRGSLPSRGRENQKSHPRKDAGKLPQRPESQAAVFSAADERKPMMNRDLEIRRELRKLVAELVVIFV